MDGLIVYLKMPSLGEGSALTPDVSDEDDVYATKNNFPFYLRTLLFNEA